MGKEKPATKVCKHCQTEIPYAAKVCPQCRKKQGGKVKWIVIGVIVLILIIALFSGGSDSDTPSDSNPKKIGESDENKNNENAESKQEEKSEFSVGDVVETSDLKISFLSAGEYETDNEFLEPEEGNVYYKMDFEFENVSKSDEYVSSFDFKCYADGYDMEQSYVDGMDLDATLSPGKKTKGSVFFQVPKDSKEITLEYETNFWTENKIVFKVK